MKKARIIWQAMLVFVVLGAGLTVFSDEASADVLAFSGSKEQRTGTDTTAVFGPGTVLGDDGCVADFPGAPEARIITGSSFDDFLLGGQGDDAIFGLEGDDDMRGGPGDDFMNGGP